MAKDKSKAANQQPQASNNVVQMPSRCPVENCGKKPQRSVFCSEHFTWFKEGLVNKEGEKPKDFDRKYQAYLRRQAA